MPDRTYLWLARTLLAVGTVLIITAVAIAAYTLIGDPR